MSEADHTETEVDGPRATEAEPSDDQKQSRRVLLALALCVGAVSTCGIVYQLVVGTISTYLLGNSTFQFSLTIGLFMSAYGLGSFLSTRIDRWLTEWFIGIEIALGFFGGTCSLALFYLYATTDLFQLGRVVLIAIIGTLVGLEIPLLIRISEQHRKNLRVTVGQMMGFDYIGALVGGIAFPLLLLPTWGLLGASFLVGLCNTLVALLTMFAFPKLRHRRVFVAVALAIIVALGFAAVGGPDIERRLEGALYEDPVVYLEQSEYQRLVITNKRDDTRLFLDGSLQFSTRDEYRYHELLVHPAALRVPELRDVLVLGGGDGMALRELRRYPEIASVTLVDLDPAVVELGRSHPALKQANGDAFHATQPRVIHDDAFTWVAATDETFDLIIVDLPDPHHESLAKLYSVTFYQALARRLTPTGLIVAQLGSPFFARDTYWTAVRTLEEAGLQTRPFHVQVPSFGEWGFAMAGRSVAQQPRRAFSARYYDTTAEDSLFRFPPDMARPATLTPNTLIRPVIVEQFRSDWRRWN